MNAFATPPDEGRTLELVQRLRGADAEAWTAHGAGDDPRLLMLTKAIRDLPHWS